MNKQPKLTKEEAIAKSKACYAPAENSGVVTFIHWPADGSKPAHLKDRKESK